jgi:hypothetical protein
MNNEHVEHDVGLLIQAIERLGTKGPDGKSTVKYQLGTCAPIYIYIYFFKNEEDAICTFFIIIWSIPMFGVLFNDDEVGNTLESLMGTLKAAKKRKRITYEGELLLQVISSSYFHPHLLFDALPP